MSKMEWSTTPVHAREGEVLYEASGYFCAFKLNPNPNKEAEAQ